MSNANPGEPGTPRPEDGNGQQYPGHDQSWSGQQAYGEGQSSSYGQNSDLGPNPSYGRQDQGGQYPAYGQQYPAYGQNSDFGPNPSYGQQDQGGQYPAYGQQYPAYGQPPFSSGPGRNAWGPDSSRPATMPREVNIGSWLIALGALLAMIYTVMQAIFIGSPQGQNYIEQALRQTGQNTQGISVAQLAGTGRAMLLVGGLIALVLYVLVVVFVRRGKNWARILGTVLAALSLVFLGFNLGGLATVVGIAGVVLLWLRPARPWFRKAPAVTPWGR
ncbi:hypothetical protein BKD30_04340 [Tersicoccus phoenicis]|uniref:DUF4064 domain-containing protein n=1 Tax=Tersicoccus phoenicis TaxID=554083 RepID=A0A1R1LHJ6_9MICC|nr:hypothetical protein [Tersicoccus phoenicis]OMH26979.1 hypothetical protein BKD30_04340 [Tersicoccus phoenicis]